MKYSGTLPLPLYFDYFVWCWLIYQVSNWPFPTENIGLGRGIQTQTTSQHDSCLDNNYKRGAEHSSPLLHPSYLNILN